MIIRFANGNFIDSFVRDSIIVHAWIYNLHSIFYDVIGIDSPILSVDTNGPEFRKLKKVTRFVKALISEYALDRLRNMKIFDEE